MGDPACPGPAAPRCSLTRSRRDRRTRHPGPLVLCRVPCGPTVLAAWLFLGQSVGVGELGRVGPLTAAMLVDVSQARSAAETERGTANPLRRRVPRSTLARVTRSAGAPTANATLGVTLYQDTDRKAGWDRTAPSGTRGLWGQRPRFPFRQFRSGASADVFDM